jgi:hypothetical protein
MHSRFPCTLRETILCVENGESREIAAFESTFQSTHAQELIVALVTKQGWKLGAAIVIATTACERCGNILAHQCGLEWGCAVDSEEARSITSKCKFCVDSPA